MFVEAFKTIGFGLFINSTYDLMKNNFSLINIYIVLISLAIVVVCYGVEKRRDK